MVRFVVCVREDTIMRGRPVRRETKQFSELFISVNLAQLLADSSGC